MLYKDIHGKVVDTKKQLVRCPYCSGAILSEDIESGDYTDRGGMLEEGVLYSCLWHTKCSENYDVINKDI